MKNNLLKQTAELMFSSDYKDRFVAEYIQLKVRYEKLKAFCNKIEAARRVEWNGTRLEEPKHDCSLDLLRDQERHMSEYLHTLEVRAVIEDIDLEDAMLYYSQKADKEDSAERLSEENKKKVVSFSVEEAEEILSDIFGEALDKLGDITVHVCRFKGEGKKKESGKNG